MSDPVGVDWTSALVVLGVGLVLGTALVWTLLARAQPAGPVRRDGPGEALVQRDLEGKREALFAQLRELEDTASKRTAEQLARERYALELEAARVLLALDAVPTGPRPEAPAIAPPANAPPPAGGSPALRGFLWGTTSAGVVGLLLFLLYTQARPRDAGGSVTGDVPMGRAGGVMSEPPSRPPDAEEAALRTRLARDPDDLEAHMDLARLHLSRQDMMGVWNETKLVLERSPGHPGALAYQALVRLAMGQGDKAVEMLEQARARDPNLIDAYVNLALVYERLGRRKEAEKAVAEASRRFPDRAASLQRLWAEIQKGSGPAAAEDAGEADPHAGLGTPGEGEAPRAAANASPAARPARRISGTVVLDPSLEGQITPGGVLFVFVREAGFGAGPPIAARRLPVSSFPMAFEIGEDDAMTGQPFPDDLLVEARLDADGDPTTRPPTDPKARIDDVKAGTTGVKLVLKRAS